LACCSWTLSFFGGGRGKECWLVCR
jgi:hypothetical protein